MKAVFGYSGDLIIGGSHPSDYVRHEINTRVFAEIPFYRDSEYLQAVRKEKPRTVFNDVGPAYRRGDDVVVGENALKAEPQLQTIVDQVVEATWKSLNSYRPAPTLKPTCEIGSLGNWN